MSSHVLEGALAPLSSYYSDQRIIELRMNRPREVILEARGAGKKRIEDEGLTLYRIEQLCTALANKREIVFHPQTNPKLSTTLPGHHRFECALGPCARSGLSLAVRCKHPFTPSWEELGIEGALMDYMQGLMAHNKNILISGATNSGKTSFLNKLLTLLPDSRRLCVLEDTPELEVERFWDGSFLLAARQEVEGQSQLSWRELADHLRRITPDSIVFGEISTSNAFAALDALNSGVTGFLCTIHANSPHQAIHRKFDQNIAFAGQKMPRIGEFICELIDAVIQIKRDPDGFRRISDIYEPIHDRYVFRHHQITAVMTKALEAMR